MNIYDKNQIECSICGRFIGEIDMDSTVIFPLCRTCNKNEKQTIRRGISKILVPVDITKKTTRALDVAIYLSKHLGSKITIMHSMPNLGREKFIRIKDILKEIQSDAEKSVKRAKRYCENKHVTANHKITRGEEAKAIIRTAKTSNYDLIVMGSSGKGMLQEFIFGSISNFVMHNSDVPVLIVKENSSKLDTSITKFRDIARKKKKP